MFPAEFDYERPDTVAEAIDLLSAEHDGQLEVLAGGHSLLPMMKTGLSRPDTLVDIGRIDELHGVETDAETTTIGAATTYADLLETPEIDAHGALADALAEIGDAQVRSRGTLGGNVANADPAADPPAAVVAEGATLIARGPDGERRVDADDFFLGMYTTDLDEDELLVGVELPREGRVGAYAKRTSPSSGYAVVGVAATFGVEGGTITDARVAANDVMDYPIRLESVEAALEGAPLTAEAVDDAAARAADDVDVDLAMDDKDASPEYREQLTVVYAERALHGALERA